MYVIMESHITHKQHKDLDFQESHIKSQNPNNLFIDLKKIHGNVGIHHAKYILSVRLRMCSPITLLVVP